MKDNKRTHGELAISRRTFLRSGIATGFSLTTFPSSFLFAAIQPKVVIVGAGLAGLTAAYHLCKKSGIKAQIFEAQSRVGGRVRTIRELSGGPTTEAGAQMIDTAHQEIQGLAKELGLQIFDLWANEHTGSDVHFFNGKNQKWSEIKSELKEVYEKAETHFEQLNWPFTFKTASERARYWDKWSVEDWIEKYCPGGTSSKTGQYLKVYFETLYAGSIEEASAIHLITGLASGSTNEDERHGIKGGTDALTSALLQRLPKESVSYGMPLLSIKSRADGRVVCSFSKDRSVTEVVADKVILALPFSILKSLDLRKAGFEPTMQTAIQDLGMGNNTKISLLFQGKPWENSNYSGGSYSDLLPSATWTAYENQSSKKGFLVCMTGSEQTRKLKSEPAHERISSGVLATVLNDTNKMFGNISSSYLGAGFLSNWPQDPWVKGSYSYYKTGGFSSFAGIESKKQGNVYFAGEHTAPYSLHGSMNGAVHSGIRVADEIMAESSTLKWPFRKSGRS